MSSETFSVRYNRQTAQWEVIDSSLPAILYYSCAVEVAQYMSGRTGGIMWNNPAPAGANFTIWTHTGSGDSGRSEPHPPDRQG